MKNNVTTKLSQIKSLEIFLPYKNKHFFMFEEGEIEKLINRDKCKYILCTKDDKITLVFGPEFKIDSTYYHANLFFFFSEENKGYKMNGGGFMENSGNKVSIIDFFGESLKYGAPDENLMLVLKELLRRSSEK